MANELDLFQILPGLQVTETEMLEAEYMSKQILQAKYPDIELREGSGVYDLVVRPSATLLALVNKALVFYFAQNTIKVVDDLTPTDFVDKIMSNWFLSRTAGTKAIINARLFFARQKNIVISQDSFFSTNGTLKFYPATTTSLSASALQFDPYLNEYYVDIELTAEQEGSSYNISTGSLLYFSIFDPYFLHAEINFLKNIADNEETNTHFVGRAETAISTRNLINNPSIISKLLQDFPVLEEVTPIGFGDIEMIRDVIKVQPPTLVDPVWIHNGGKVDAYCRCPLASNVVQLIANSEGVLSLTGPVYKFNRSLLSGGDSEDTFPYWNKIDVTSVTRTGQVVTVTTTTAHGYSTGDSINISGAVQAGYNGTFSITITSTTSYTYTLPSGTTPVTPATGTIKSGKQSTYTSQLANLASADLLGLSNAAGIATGILPNHGFTDGRYLSISGATQSEYNGTHLLLSTTKDTFSYAISTGVTSPATGTPKVKYSIPQKDYSFSNKQEILIDLGIANAGKTASFEIFYFQDIDGIQTYLDDSSRKVLCGDYLARGYNLYLLDFTVTSYNGPAADTATTGTIIKNYLAGLVAGETFVMSDLVAKLFAAGITTIKTPIDISYTFYNRDFRTLTGTIQDTLNPHDRTAIFMINSITTQSTNL